MHGYGPEFQLFTLSLQLFGPVHIAMLTLCIIAKHNIGPALIVFIIHGILGH